MAVAHSTIKMLEIIVPEGYLIVREIGTFFGGGWRGWNVTDRYKSAHNILRSVQILVLFVRRHKKTKTIGSVIMIRNVPIWYKFKKIC